MRVFALKKNTHTRKRVHKHTHREKEMKDMIMEFYPEVNPPFIDLIAGLKPDILALIAGTPILDHPPA